MTVPKTPQPSEKKPEKTISEDAMSDRTASTAAMSEMSERSQASTNSFADLVRRFSGASVDTVAGKDAIKPDVATPDQKLPPTIKKRGTFAKEISQEAQDKSLDMYSGV